MSNVNRYPLIVIRESVHECGWNVELPISNVEDNYD